MGLVNLNSFLINLLALGLWIPKKEHKFAALFADVA